LLGNYFGNADNVTLLAFLFLLQQYQRDYKQENPKSRLANTD